MPGFEPMATVNNALTDTTHFDLASCLYLDLMKQCLTRSFFSQSLSKSVVSPLLRDQPFAWFMYFLLKRLMELLGLGLSRRASSPVRAEGRDWPSDAETMIGSARLANLQA